MKSELGKLLLSMSFAESWRQLWKVIAHSKETVVEDDLVWRAGSKISLHDQTPWSGIGCSSGNFPKGSRVRPTLRIPPWEKDREHKKSH